MSNTLTSIMLALLLATPTLAASPERWQRLSIPVSGSMVGMGELPFPDGQRAVWISTTAGSFRRIQGEWERWPVIDGENPILRSILVAPDVNGLTSWWLATPAGLLLTSNGADWTRHDEQTSALADRDILDLYLSQSSAGQPEVWIGSQSGLTIWRMGHWEAVLARPDGFQGGPVTTMRGLFHNGQRQTWVAGPTGLSRFQNDRWQRWAGACLRGLELHAIETLETGQGMVLLAGTDRGLKQLSLDDPEFCQPLNGADIIQAPVRGLARDRHERLLAFTPDRVERFEPPDRVREGWRWTFFDSRDGLEESLAWTGRQRLDGEGRIWAASATGLWLFDPAEPPGPLDRRPALALGQGEERIPAGSDQALTVGGAEPALALAVPPTSRPHAMRFRFRLLPEPSFGPWQAQAVIEPGPLSFGDHLLAIEMADEFGHVHGPYLFPIQRSWPGYLVGAAMVLVLLAVAGALVLLRRRA